MATARFYSAAPDGRLAPSRPSVRRSPIGADAVLYLQSLPDIPPEEQDLWFNVTPDRQLWVPTTPQGFILDIPDDGAIDRVDVPIEHETGELVEQPEDGAPLDRWLPPTGEKLPSDLAP